MRISHEAALPGMCHTQEYRSNIWSIDKGVCVVWLVIRSGESDSTCAAVYGHGLKSLLQLLITRWTCANCTTATSIAWRTF